MSRNGSVSVALGESYLHHIDLRDLTRGEGEWRNMQEVIRRTFRVLFEQIHSQQLQITSLVESIANLKKESYRKVNSVDLSRIIDSKMTQSGRSSGTAVDDCQTLRIQMTELRSALEKKASVRYVDDLLQRKVNKTDLLFTQPQHHHHPPYHPHPSTQPSGTPQVIESMSSKISSLEQRMVAMETMMKLSTEHDQILFQSQLNDLKAKMVNKVDAKEMETALMSRVERADLDLQLHQKADRNSINEVRKSLGSICFSDLPPL